MDEAAADLAQNRAQPHPVPPQAVPPLVRFAAITKTFGPLVAVNDVSLDIRKGEFLALLGPSGCGKTTLLRILGGFETPDSGRVLIEGRDMTGVPPHRRPLNTMFQSYALFPHLDVAANVAFGLRYDGVRGRQAMERVREMLALVRLDGLERRRPHELSGGQRSRVALARALAKRPKLLLLDEPMAALDRKLRESTQRELADIQRRLGTTFVMVTHDQDEAMTVADRIAIMEHGRLARIDTPAAIYEQPRSRYVASFLGEANVLEGRWRGDAHGARVEVQGLAVRVEAAPPAREGEGIWLAIRPEKIALAATPQDARGDNVFGGEVTARVYRGDVSMFEVKLDGGPAVRVMAANTTARDAQRHAAGARVWIAFDADAAHVLTE